MTAARELRRLKPTRDGQNLETRARCQDDGHPVGAVHPDWRGRGPASFCHCGRIVYRGVHQVVRWPRPPTRHRGRPVFS